MKRNALAVACLALAACGAIPPSSHATVDGCATQSTGLLTASEVGPNLFIWHDGTSPTLGLWNNGDASYPNFKGSAERVFLWNGLNSGTPLSLINQAWASLHYSGAAPVGFIPQTGALFSAYPSQVFRVSEATLDFGTAAGAEHWMSAQRSMNVPNAEANTRNGIETNPATTKVGDDTFAYQLSNGPSSDQFTDVQALVGTVVYGIGIDSGPSFDALPMAVDLATRLEAKEVATCGLVTPS